MTNDLGMENLNKVIENIKEPNGNSGDEKWNNWNFKIR